MKQFAIDLFLLTLCAVLVLRWNGTIGDHYAGACQYVAWLLIVLAMGSTLFNVFAAVFILLVSSIVQVAAEDGDVKRVRSISGSLKPLKLRGWRRPFFWVVNAFGISALALNGYVFWAAVVTITIPIDLACIGLVSRSFRDMLKARDSVLGTSETTSA